MKDGKQKKKSKAKSPRNKHRLKGSRMGLQDLPDEVRTANGNFEINPSWLNQGLDWYIFLVSPMYSSGFVFGVPSIQPNHKRRGNSTLQLRNARALIFLLGSMEGVFPSQVA